MAHLLRRLRRAKEDGYEGQPDDAGGVHGEADGFGLVEGLGDSSALDGVHRARDHQHETVAQAEDERQVGHVALEDPAGELRVRGLLLLVVDDGVGRHHAKPDEHPEQLRGKRKRESRALRRIEAARDESPPPYLHRDEHKGDNQLRGGTDELGGRDRDLALLEDAVDAVGLGEHGGVADAHAEPQQQPAEGAHGHAGLGDHEEGDEVDEEDARQQHVAELAAGGPDDGRVVEADEGDDAAAGGQAAQDGQEHGDDGPGRAPLQLDDGRAPAARAVLQGPHVEGAHVAGGLVQQVLVAVAELAVPAAGNALHHLLPLSGLAREAAHRRRDLAVAARPLHLLQLGDKTQNTLFDFV